MRGHICLLRPGQSHREGEGTEAAPAACRLPAPPIGVTLSRRRRCLGMSKASDGNLPCRQPNLELPASRNVRKKVNCSNSISTLFHVCTRPSQSTSTCKSITYIAEQIINTDLSCNFNYFVVFSHWCKFGSESYVVFFFFQYLLS